MRRGILALAVSAGASLALVAPALGTAAAAPARESAVKSFLTRNTIVTGFYRGSQVRYFDFGPVKLGRGNKTAPIWTVTNGVAGQHNIIDAVPGQKAYSPLWAVRAVTFAQGATPRLLTSKAAVEAAVRAGDARVTNMRVVVNCPVI
jgi:hypothetical protein